MTTNNEIKDKARSMIVMWDGIFPYDTVKKQKIAARECVINTCIEQVGYSKDMFKIVKTVEYWKRVYEAI